LVPTWCPFSDKEQIIYCCLAERVLEECKKAQPHVKPDAPDWVPIDAELLKRVYDELVMSSGADVLFHSVLSAVEKKEEDGVGAIIVSNKNGLTAYRAAVFIDYSGDADLCAWAGANFHQGDEDGSVMPATHCFLLANVDQVCFRENYDKVNAFHAGRKDSPIYKIIESGRFRSFLTRTVAAPLWGRAPWASTQATSGTWITPTRPAFRAPWFWAVKWRTSTAKLLPKWRPMPLAARFW